ncbi:DUF3592 domain-containing protein [Aquimarina sp. SS2-1]|uniref:DUF3592 domain-containing protein n=1 Tax=Aquimarina besae TaxID=3342247 RepID=UPI00366FD95C
MSRKYLGLLTVLVVAVGVLAFNNYNNKAGLVKNGVITTAVIEKISKNKIDNEFSPTVENIHIKYFYTIDSKKYTKTEEISKHEQDLYFTKKRKVGDSVKIIYDSEKPGNSRMKKIK